MTPIGQWTHTVRGVHIVEYIPSHDGAWFVAWSVDGADVDLHETGVIDVSELGNKHADVLLAIATRAQEVIEMRGRQ